MLLSVVTRGAEEAESERQAMLSLLELGGCITASAPATYEPRAWHTCGLPGSRVRIMGNDACYRNREGIIEFYDNLNRHVNVRLSHSGRLVQFYPSELRQVAADQPRQHTDQPRREPARPAPTHGAWTPTWDAHVPDTRARQQYGYPRTREIGVVHGFGLDPPSIPGRPVPSFPRTIRTYPPPAPTAPPTPNTHTQGTQTEGIHEDTSGTRRVRGREVCVVDGIRCHVRQILNCINFC